MKSLLHIVFVLFFSMQMQAQEKIITGIVTSFDGAPLPAANVIIKGTSNGVQTDFDGKYSIVTIKGKILVFSYLGFITKEVPVIDSSIINVVLDEDSSIMSEVVVTAFGIKRESKSISYSVKTVTSESLSMRKKGNDEPQSGQLTAGEINDLEKWEGWLKALKSKDNLQIKENWKFHLEKKVDIHVLDSKSSPLNNIKVAIYNSKNEQIMLGRTDFNGNVTLFKDLNSKSDCDFYTVQITQGNRVIGKKLGSSVTNLKFVLEDHLASTNHIDVMFTIDATGSMGDEINYLKSELKDIIGRLDESIDQKRLALTFYRDHGDAYLVKDLDFSTDIDSVKAFLSQQSAGGGGDYEEAVEEALKVSMSKSWHMDAKSKLLFLLLDAPPHYNQENVEIIKKQIKIAQEKGIKIIPIVASGANKNVEFLMRYFSVATNGTYVFLTDDSGIGNPHIKPTTDDFKVEKLNDLIVRLIEKYSGVNS
ncbi:MAG: carboxypeptidase-like regulatory domain-containing protein [Aquaticitalea sp.]